MELQNLNVEADISQGIDKRMIFYQAIKDTNKPRILILNGVYYENAKSFLKDKAYFADDLNGDLFLSNSLLSNDKNRLALVKAYLAVTNKNLSPLLADSVLTILNQSSLKIKKPIIEIIYAWTKLNSEELVAELSKTDLSALPKKQQSKLQKFILLIKNRSIDTIIDFLNSILKIHLDFLSMKEFTSNDDWQSNKALIIVSGSKINVDSYAKLILNFGIYAGVQLYLDTELNLQKHLDKLLSSTVKVSISINKAINTTLKGDLGYLAKNIYISTQNFDTNLYVNWMAHTYPTALDNSGYSKKDFQLVFDNFGFSSFYSCFLGAENDSMYLYHFANKDTLQLQKKAFKLEPIIEATKANDKVENNSNAEVIKALKDGIEEITNTFNTKVELLENQIAKLNDKRQNVKEEHTTSDDINFAFEQALAQQTEE